MPPCPPSLPRATPPNPPRGEPTPKKTSVRNNEEPPTIGGGMDLGEQREGWPGLSALGEHGGDSLGSLRFGDAEGFGGYTGMWGLLRDWGGWTILGGLRTRGDSGFLGALGDWGILGCQG